MYMVSCINRDNAITKYESVILIYAEFAHTSLTETLYEIAKISRFEWIICSFQLSNIFEDIRDNWFEASHVWGTEENVLEKFMQVRRGLDQITKNQRA